MAKAKRKSWSTITREERYFTSLLYHDVRSDPDRLLNLLRREMGLPPEITVTEVGYEVCFFRDAYASSLIARHRALEQQTFDLVLFLDSDQMLIIEAKAQQGFTTRQIENLKTAKPKIAASGYEPKQDVKLVALYSSRYSPREQTRKAFDARITWREIANALSDSNYYPDYLRADGIYADRRFS